ncbi:hypothetical protein PROFUN_03627 [Planoprotostelium fungivorum]|uniref:Uncharacterized protein n=1 Tax=Planoprotostelium fungivorum TaxID=1890364 RepID=A0A2P6NSD6_9EUKA|nr:hypothetical protein PROFUN_03627 [Planoprotostelium fungivorum]
MVITTNGVGVTRSYTATSATFGKENCHQVVEYIQYTVFPVALCSSYSVIPVITVK